MMLAMIMNTMKQMSCLSPSLSLLTVHTFVYSFVNTRCFSFFLLGKEEINFLYELSFFFK